MDIIRLTGWIGIFLMAVSFCTAVRSPTLNLIIGGYRRQLRLHHWFGLLAVAAMLAHLGLLFLDYSETLNLLFNPLDVGIWTGWIALICSVTVAAVAFNFRRAPYRRWRRVHLVLTFGFIAGVFHSFLILEPRNSSEWYLIIALVSIGICGIAWSVLIPLLPHFGDSYAIVRQTKLRPNLFLQVLRPAKPVKSAVFTAGHFIYLRYGASQFTNIWHPFTVVGFSDSGEFELLVKTRGRDTNLLPTLNLPSRVQVNGPFGIKFWQSDEPQLWIAYGAGIAIFLGAARSMPPEFSSEIHLIYCEKDRDHIVFAEEFDALSAQKNNFSWNQSFGEGRQVISSLDNMMHVWSSKYRLFRICGHPGFQDALRDLLIAGGVSKKAIILEGVF